MDLARTKLFICLWYNSFDPLYIRHFVFPAVLDHICYPAFKN